MMHVSVPVLSVVFVFVSSVGRKKVQPLIMEELSGQARFQSDHELAPRYRASCMYNTNSKGEEELLDESSSTGKQ